MCRNCGASRNWTIAHCASISVSVIYIFALRVGSDWSRIKRQPWAASPQAGTLRTGYWTDGITLNYQFSQWSQCRRAATDPFAPDLQFLFLFMSRSRDGSHPALLQRRVWSWLRMNAGGVPNTCKSNDETALGRTWSGERVSNTWPTCPPPRDSPPKGGLIPGTPEAAHAAPGKAQAAGDGVAAHQVDGGAEAHRADDG